MSYGTTECLDACLDGQYANKTSRKCLVCDSNCHTCNNTASECLSCYMEAGAYVFLHGSICIQRCPVGFYGETSNSTCQVCADGCKTCEGSTSKDCLTCLTFNSTAYYRWANETTCDTFCPDGQFASLILNHQCDYCSSNCVTCVGRADNCTADGGCRFGQFFNNETYQCVSVCPNGLYGNTSSGFCENCADGCTLCFGFSLSDCTKCGPNPNNLTEKYYKNQFLT